MKQSYDIVYLTNTPSFYKLNLCDRLAKEGLRILLVFYGYGSEAVNTALSNKGDYLFDYHFIHEGDSNARPFLRTFLRLRKLMKTIDTRIVLYSGWLANEYNLYSFISPKRKNAVVVESGYESSEKGIKGWLKRRIIGRMAFALPSGAPHTQLLSRLGFKGKILPTGSVGIFHKPGRPADLPHKPENNAELKYLYVGRLIDCKNLRFLIEQFNKNGRSLTIVGKGNLEEELKSIAKENISFLGFMDNKKLGDIYQSHDVFILPSISETWGLVIEEALYWGLPVLVSDRVGANIDMVEKLGTGRIFKYNDSTDFGRKILEIQENYAIFANAVAKIDFDERDRGQIEAYQALL